MTWEGARLRDPRWIGYEVVAPLNSDARRDLATPVPSLGTMSLLSPPLWAARRSRAHAPSPDRRGAGAAAVGGRCWSYIRIPRREPGARPNAGPALPRPARPRRCRQRAAPHGPGRAGRPRPPTARRGPHPTLGTPHRAQALLTEAPLHRLPNCRTSAVMAGSPPTARHASPRLPSSPAAKTRRSAASARGDRRGTSVAFAAICRSTAAQCPPARASAPTSRVSESATADTPASVPSRSACAALSAKRPVPLRSSPSVLSSRATRAAVPAPARSRPAAARPTPAPGRCPRRSSRATPARAASPGRGPRPRRRRAPPSPARERRAVPRDDAHRVRSPARRSRDS